MKIYTRTGDKGMTSLAYGKRIPKHDIRVDAYGTCDEANSVIGLALSYLEGIEFAGKSTFEKVFHEIQTSLFHVGAELATPVEKEVRWKLAESDISEMEKVIDEWDKNLPELKNFILPSGHPAGATMHLARTIVRRAERLAVQIDEVNPLVLAYLNRLSDLLFVAARYINHQLNATEKVLHENI